MRGVSAALMAVRQRVERWRKNDGGRGSRIPEDLWNHAARVARTEGVYATARVLRFNYERLKARAGEAKGRDGSGRQGEPAFVELPTGLLGRARTVVELVGRSGEQMRIHIASASTSELVALAQAFWGRQS